jgi:hypothetical protein
MNTIEMKLPREWAEEDGIEIMDNDGFRNTWDTYVTEEEYEKGILICTITEKPVKLEKFADHTIMVNDTKVFKNDGSKIHYYRMINGVLRFQKFIEGVNFDTLVLSYSKRQVKEG